MKIPYSYRQQFFVPVLMVSLLGHAAVFATGAGLFSLSPEYGIEQASSSLEVVITKPQAETKKKQPEEVLTSLQSTKAVSVKKINPKKERLEPLKPIYAPPQKGALSKKASAYFKNPAPVYPERAREHGWEGLVMLSVFVRRDGTPGQVEVEKSSGFKILDEAAVKAVQKWKFKPAGIGNVSFSTWVRIPVRFTLVEE